MYSQVVTPSNYCKTRLKDRESRLGHYEQVHIRLRNLRLLLALGLVMIAWESLRKRAFSPWWMLVALLRKVMTRKFLSYVLANASLFTRYGILEKSPL
jgi:hypothetical protein